MITFDGTSNKLNETVADTGTKAVVSTVYLANNQSKLVIGNKLSNVLNNFGITVTGTQPLNATMEMALPDSVESTGLYIPLLTKAYRSWASGDSYDVKINFTDGTSKEFKDVKEGTTLSTLPQTGSVNTTTMFNLPVGASVKSYDITPNFTLNPGDMLYSKRNAGGELDNALPTENDVQATSFSTLGYVKDGVADQSKVPFVLTTTDNDTGKVVDSITQSATALASAPISLDVTPNNTAPLNPSQQFNVLIGDGTKAAYTNPNLNANGFFVNNQPNTNYDPTVVNNPSAKDGNDMPGYNGVGLTKKRSSILCNSTKTNTNCSSS